MSNFKIALGAAFILTAATTSSWADTTVNVTLADNGENVDLSKNLGMVPGSNMDMAKAPMSIKAEPAEVPAGKVTFQVSNGSKATIHEMILATYSDKSKALPYIENENRADEDKAGDIGEVSELDPGKSGALTADLKPGTYILFCNVPGHLGAGMWTTVTVK